MVARSSIEGAVWLREQLSVAMRKWLWHKDRDAVTYSDGKSGSW
jgi:hypothetical protein